MDPLSIAASTITVATAASAVSVALYEFSSNVRNADTRVSKLCAEVSTLVGLLEAVGQTLRQYREHPVSLPSDADDLWRQSTLALSDCQTTLGELDTLIGKIKATTTHGGIFRKAKIAVALTAHSRDIAGFQDKIHKSNCALQTMLAAINVSLSLHGNATQDTTLQELRRLRCSINQCLQMTPRRSDRFLRRQGHRLSDISVTRNLRNLAYAAQGFHSTASSTTTTIHGANRSLPQDVESEEARSAAGTLTSDKRKRIQDYLKRTGNIAPKRWIRHRTPGLVAASSILSTRQTPSSSSSVIGSEVDDCDEDRDYEAEFELLFLNGLEEVAKENVLNRDFVKAETFLRRAIQHHSSFSSANDSLKQLRVQLAICYIFQHKWRLAEPLITDIAKSKARLCVVVCNLLHALALGYLSEYNFERATTLCKRALHGKKRLEESLGVSYMSEYNETLGLLATIYDIQGDLMDAEILRFAMPPEFTYTHPTSMLDFLIKHPTLFRQVFGRDMPSGWGLSQDVPTGRQIVFELPDTKATAPTPTTGNMEPYSGHPRSPRSPQQTLREKLDLCEKIEIDTAKEAVVSSPSTLYSNHGTDSAASTPTELTTPSPSSSPRLSKLSFSRRITDLLDVLRTRPTTAPTESTPPPSPESETLPSPLRRRLAAGFWQDSHVFGLKKPKVRLQKEPGDGTGVTSFSVLRASLRGHRFKNLNTDASHCNSEGLTQLERQSPNCEIQSQEMEVVSPIELSDGPLLAHEYHGNSQIYQTMRYNPLCSDTFASNPLLDEENGNTSPSTKGRISKPKLVIRIPNSAKLPGYVPLLEHYPRYSPPTPVQTLPVMSGKAHLAQKENTSESEMPDIKPRTVPQSCPKPNSAPFWGLTVGGSGINDESVGNVPEVSIRNEGPSLCYSGDNNTPTPDLQQNLSPSLSSSFSFTLEFDPSTEEADIVDLDPKPSSPAEKDKPTAYSGRLEDSSSLSTALEENIEVAGSHCDISFGVSGSQDVGHEVRHGGLGRQLHVVENGSDVRNHRTV